MGTDKAFVVAASRMGKVENPAWCFTDTPFFPLPGLDQVKSDTDINKNVIRVGYTYSYFIADLNTVFQIACETL